MEIQTSVAPAEVWLREDLEKVHALLFRYVGEDKRLALCSVTTQQFVILVLDPIVFLPWSVLPDCAASFVRTRSRHIFQASLAFLFVVHHEEQGRHMGDGAPTDQQSHNHCDCTDGHCSDHIVASCVLVPLVPTLITRRRRRVPSTMSTSRSSSARASLVSPVKTRLTTLPSEGGQLRTGKSDVHQQPIAGLTLLALCCPIGAAARVNVDFHHSMWFCVPFCPMTCHKSIDRAASAMRWTA